MAQNFQDQLDLFNDGINTIASRAINPEEQIRQAQQILANSGYDLDPQQTMPKSRSFMPTVLGIGLGTAIGALAGNGMNDALIGGISGGIAGYTGSNKKRNEYIANTLKKNQEIMKNVYENALNVGNQASSINSLTGAMKNTSQMQSDKNYGDMLFQNLPNNFKKPKMLFDPQSAQEPNPQLDDANSIITGYGGIQNAKKILNSPNLSENERILIEDSLSTVTGQNTLTGGIVTDNQPLYLAKPQDIERRIIAPTKLEKEQANVGLVKQRTVQSKSATVKNYASTKNINKRTSEIGKKGAEQKAWEVKENQKNSVANMRSEWDNAMQGYKQKHGKKPSSQAIQGMKNALRNKYKNNIYYQGEKYLH